MERTIARCRLALSLVALATLWLDPTRPAVAMGFELRGWRFSADPYAAGALAAHLCFSLAVLLWLRRFGAGRLALLSTVGDVLFAGAISFLTEGVTSPYFAFFVFAVAASSFRSELRGGLLVVAAAVGIYLSLVFVSRPDLNLYVMRSLFLMAIGYVIVHLVNRRSELEAQLQQLQAAADRSSAACLIHDNSVQALAGLQVGLEGCRRLLEGGHRREARGELAALQTELARAYQEVRSCARELAQVDATPVSAAGEGETQVVVRTDFAGPVRVIDAVLQIVREGVENVRRHAKARSARVTVDQIGARLLIGIDDDGVGFATGERLPWSIESRVRATKGSVHSEPAVPGAHLRISIPISGARLWKGLYASRSRTTTRSSAKG